MTTRNAGVGIVIVAVVFVVCATGGLSSSKMHFLGIGAEADGTSTILISLDSTAWMDFGTTSSSPVLRDDQNGNLTFAFPNMSSTTAVCTDYSLSSSSCSITCADYTSFEDSINYLYATPGISSIAGYNSISASLEVNTTGSVVFNYQTELDNTCVFPAHARAFIWQWNDAAQGYDRWYSNSIAYELASGTATLTTPLTPDQWLSVYGELGNSSASATQGFYDALNNVRYVGLVFGGGCFYGHGVNVSSGTAEFILANYSLQ